jgi:ATP-dependent RNA helicase DDX23/PRP28
MEVDEATIVTASTKRGASEDPQDAAKRLRTDDADAMDEAAARTRAEMTPAEREEAERLHRTAVRAEALAAAQAAAKERGVSLTAAEVAALKKEQEAKPKFVSKKERERLALERLEAKRRERELKLKSGPKFSAPLPRKEPSIKKAIDDYAVLRDKPKKVPAKDSAKEQELAQIRENYLGKKGKKKQPKPSEKFARVFQFDWDANDDTSQDLNPLYARRHAIQPMLGRGYLAGLDMREQRRAHTFSQALNDKRASEARAQEEAEGLARTERKKREAQRKKERDALTQALAAEEKKVEATALGKKLLHWTEKSLAEMNARDWRIMKEDFDIRTIAASRRVEAPSLPSDASSPGMMDVGGFFFDVEAGRTAMLRAGIRGGKAPPPLRFWNEMAVPEGIHKAIQDAKYRDPSPIQRQAIPVGLELRDLIGVAETGSGKTAAFAVPLLAYVAQLPAQRIASLAEDGPLAVVLAPTRELAQQINDEIAKLSSYLSCKTTTIVGGRSIEDQGFLLREGVEIIVGTPGRINDCLESQYLVLNQANYVVLDEADRMIDMGFEPQVHTILEAMGGLLMSEDAILLEQQRAALSRGEACYRITAMFSATMPPGVEKLAKKFLRHPAIVCIGDEDSGKNKRIRQHVLFISEQQKKQTLIDLLRRKQPSEKYLVFCNEKRGCDALKKVVENAQIRCGVLHGGKTQDQREAALENYKRGTFRILIATDVAGRGLDIPDVAHVVNFDMPLKIENYSHRIGRTGRAGKNGVASTLLTDSDEAMFYELREYLEQTDADIPQKLEKHPAAHAKPGERNARGELLTERAGMRGTQFLDARKFEQG